MLVSMQIGKSHLKSALGGSIKEDNNARQLIFVVFNSQYIQLSKNIRGTFFC